MIIAPSLLAANHADLCTAARAAEAAGADWLHVDVMDGRFVPAITFGDGVVKGLVAATPLPLDVHLMVANPLQQAPRFLDAGAHRLAIHVECDHVAETLALIRQAGRVAALAINPATPPPAVLPFAAVVQQVTVMTVMPGAGGQALLPETLSKFAELRRLLGPDVTLVADGGVNMATAKSVIVAGADVLVAGSAVFGAGDMAKAIADLRQVR